MSIKPEPEPSPPPATPARRFTDAVEAPTTVIGPGTRIEGELSGGDVVDLAGTLIGDSHVSALFRVREGARVVGNIEATSAVVQGEVSGQTLVAEKVEIGAAARVRANVRARVVAIAEGASFDGEVHTQDSEGPAGPLAFTEKRKG